jgi:LysR family transcriptional activator of nhaA
MVHSRTGNPMDWLNYHHLYYFWVVARGGSIRRATEELRVAQPTISGQLRALEEALGEKLFVRAGRGLALTETGRTVFQYADEIFALGRELKDALRGRAEGRTLRFVVGVADSLPKLAAQKLLAPALSLSPPVHAVVRSDRTDRLMGDLALHRLDLVLTDEPHASSASAGTKTKVRAYNHLLGECGVTFLGAPEVVARLARPFPQCLADVPVLLPGEGSFLRGALETFFAKHDLSPRVAVECQDSAIVKMLGAAGAGVFAVPRVLENEVKRYYGAERVGRTDDVRMRFFAISLERRVKHPAVAAIMKAARAHVFGQGT